MSRATRRAAERRSKRINHSAKVVSVSMLAGMAISMAPAAAYAAELPSPTAPETTDNCGIDNDFTQLPEQAGVAWYQVIEENTMETRVPVSGQVSLTELETRFVALPTSESDTFVNGLGEITYTVNVTDEPCAEIPPVEGEAISITPNTPVAIDPCDVGKDGITINAQQGLTYSATTEDGQVIELVDGFNLINFVGDVQVAAVPDAGYVLTDGAKGVFDFTLTDVDCPILVTPAEATEIDLSGTENDRIVIPVTEGVNYFINGVATEAGSFQANGVVRVSAVAAEGYQLAPGSPTTWVYDFEGTVINDIVVTPAVVTSVDASGTANDVIVIPESEGVTYFVNDVAAEAGNVKATGNVTVRAEANDGYALADDATSVWTFNFSSDVDVKLVTPAAPVFNDLAGTENDTITIPAGAGVSYFVDGVQTPAGTVKAAGNVVVTAEPVDGYALTEQATNTWNFTFTNIDAVEEIVIVEAKTPNFNRATNVVTIPDVNGVQYYLGLDPVNAGEYTISEDTVVSAEALEGFETPENSTLSWTFAFTVAEPEEPVTAPIDNPVTPVAENPVIVPAAEEIVPADNCDDINKENIPESDPDYSPKLDRDNDGFACDTDGGDAPVPAGTPIDINAGNTDENIDPDVPVDFSTGGDFAVDAPFNAEVTADLGNCDMTESRNIPSDSPEYSSARDGGSDGIACEDDEAADLANTGNPLGLGLLAGGGIMSALGLGFMTNRKRKMTV